MGGLLAEVNVDGERTEPGDSGCEISYKRWKVGKKCKMRKFYQNSDVELTCQRRM